MNSVEASLLDTTAAKKRSAKTVIPTCAKSAGTQQGSWCYGECPAGTEAERTRCRTKCSGDFPAGTPWLCGKSNHALFMAVQEMAVQAWRSGISPKLIASSVVTAEGMSSTTNSL